MRTSIFTAGAVAIAAALTLAGPAQAAEPERRHGDPEPFELKLATCGGRWLDEQQDYGDNVIVTAVPA